MLRIECLYARQLKEDAAELLSQKNACRAWAGATGGEIVREVEETVSPTTAMVDRPAIQDILADLACGLFDLLLLSDSARLIGSRKDISSLMLILEQNRKPLCFADHDGIVPTEMLPTGTVIPALVIVNGEEERKD